MSSVHWLRLWLSCTLGALCAFAVEPVTIGGIVTDADTKLPVPGAELALRYTNSAAHIASATSDASGTFHFTVEQPGAYTVEATAAGYLGTEYHSVQPSIRIEDNDFNGSGPAANRNIRVSIPRAVAVRGQLRDAETRQPLAGFSVKLIRLSWFRGRRRFSDQDIASTDEKGEFRLDAVTGEYLLDIWKAPADNRILTGRQPDYSPKSPNVPRYPVTTWPAGDPATVFPLTVRSGADFDAGAISISKIRLGRIRSSIPRAQCVEGRATHVRFEQISVNDRITRGTLNVECGGDFTIANLSPGQYRIEEVTFSGPGGLTTAPPDGAPFANPETRFQVVSPDVRIASAIVNIGEGTDLDLDLTLQPALNIAGRIECECAEGWDAALSGAQIRVAPVGGINASRKTPIDSQNAFRIEERFGEPESIALDPLPQGTLIKDIRYNGVVTGNTFAPDPNAASQSLTIVLTDKPAHLTGAVYRNESPVSGAHVAVARWPLSTVGGFPDYRTIESDPHGEFSMDPPAGTWHVIGVDAAAWQRSQMPDVLAHWFAAGQEVTVADGERRVLRIEINPSQ